MDVALSNVKGLPEPLDRGEDPEDWLTVDAQDFDQMLEATLGGGKRNSQKNDSEAMDVDPSITAESEEDRLASEQAKRLKDLASKVESFVEGEGDLEGARFDE